MRNLLLATLLASAAIAAVARAESTEATLMAGCYQMERLFDPDLSPQAAAQEVAALQVSAEHGSATAAYLLGTLYRLGPSHPAARLPRDRDLARKWLTQSALAGNLGGMAGLAELERSQGRHLEELALTRVRKHYAENHPDAWLASVERYTNLLVKRAETTLMREGAGDRAAEVQAAVDAFIAEHGAAIEARIGKRDRMMPGTRCPGFYDSERWPLAIRSTRALYGPPMESPPEYPSLAWLIPLVNGKGRVEKVLVVDYSAPPEGLRVMRGMVKSQRYNRLPDAPMRSALLPTTLH